MRPADFKLERYFAKYEFATRFLLSSSDCQALTVQELLALEPGATDRLLQLPLTYIESRGQPALREAICALYEQIRIPNVLTFTGAQEGILIFMQAALQAGDHVIVHWPCYQSLEELPRALGCEVSRWETRAENNWALDLEQLTLLKNSRTRAIIVNSPHNPTGYVMPKSVQTELVRFARQHGLLLLSDDVYRFSEFNPADQIPAACDVYENAVSLGVLSKTFGLPGLRLGWVATQNTALLERMAALKDYTTICNPAPSELLAEIALRHWRKIAAQNLELIRTNWSIFTAFLNRHTDTLDCVHPRGGTMALPWFRDGRNTDALSEMLATQYQTMLLPGSVFDCPSPYFRIGMGRRDFPQALRVLENALHDHAKNA